MGDQRSRIVMISKGCTEQAEDCLDGKLDTDEMLVTERQALQNAEERFYLTPKGTASSAISRSWTYIRAIRIIVIWY
jgi:hypothetical protein